MNTIETPSALDLLRQLREHCRSGGAIYGTNPLLLGALELLERSPAAANTSAPRSFMPVRHQLTPEELETRKHTLGSSEIGSVCGVNPWSNRYDVWLSKCTDEVREETEATILGQIAEPTIFSFFCDRYNVDLVRGKYLVGPEPWMACTPDAYVVGGPGLVEAKLVGFHTFFMWGQGNTDDTESDEVPQHYHCQAQWQMICTGEPWVKIAALMGTEFRTYTIRANEKIQRMLVEQGRRFWFDYVATRTPPPVDGSESARKMLQSLYPRDGAPPVQATDELEQLAETLRRAREGLERAEEEKRLAENRLKELLRDAGGAYGNGWRLRYRTIKGGKRPFVFEHQREKSGKAA